MCLSECREMKSDLVSLLRHHDSTAPCLYSMFQNVIVAQFPTSPFDILILWLRNLGHSMLEHLPKVKLKANLVSILLFFEEIPKLVMFWFQAYD